MSGNNSKRNRVSVNNGMHRVPVVDKRPSVGWNQEQKPWYGHKRESDLSIRTHQGDIVLATFLDRRRSGYVLHNHPALVLSADRFIADTRKVWVIPMFRDASIGFNGEADVEIFMEDCSGLRNDGHLSVNMIQCIPMYMVIKKIGRLETDRVLVEVEEKLFSQIGLKRGRGV